MRPYFLRVGGECGGEGGGGGGVRGGVLGEGCVWETTTVEKSCNKAWVKTVNVW